MNKVYLITTLLLCVAFSLLGEEKSNGVLSLSAETKSKISKAYQLLNSGNYDDALVIFKRLTSSEDKAKSLGLSSMNYENIIEHIGSCYKGKQQYSEAIRYYLKADSLNKALSLGSWDREHLNTYKNLADCYLYTSQPDTALDWGGKYIEATKRFKGQFSKELFNAYKNVYNIAIRIGKQSIAMDMLDKHIQIGIQNDYFDREEDFENFLALCLLKYNLNQCDEAIELGENIEGVISEYYPASLIHLQFCNVLFKQAYTTQKYDKAENYLNRAMEIVDILEEKGIKDDNIYTAYNNYAFYNMNSDPEKSLTIFLSLKEELENDGKTDSGSYPMVLNNLSLFKGLDNQESAHLLEEAFSRITSFKSVDITDILLIGYNRILCYHQLNDTVNSIRSIKELHKIISEESISALANLSEEKREVYWNQVKNWYYLYMPVFAFSYNKPELWELLYDGILESRGILLSSTISLSRLIRESNDSVLNILHNQAQEINNEELQKKIIRESKKYGNFMDAFRVNHKDVRSVLKKNEIAVEFFKYDTKKFAGFLETQDSDSIYSEPLDARYFAFIIKPDSDSPSIVELCDEAEISNDLYSCYQKIWKHILQDDENIDTVYFSPDGILHLIPIECAIEENNNLLSDRVKLYRLSSTRELLLNQPRELSSAALFGGMKFNLSVDEMIADHNRNKTPDFRARGTLRASEPLPATKVEVESIYKLLKTIPSFSESSKIFTDDTATESAFKSFSGRSTGVIHIATHGFYESQDDTYNDDDTLNNNRNETNELFQSGLLFSGSDNTRLHDSVPEGIEDGVLYAGELVNLDFKNTDLVIMSACRTGLGRVTEDGVFGLQRGFKKAGVNSLIMSLRKVDDNATCYFMTEFYRNLFQNQHTKGNKYLSFENARKSVRAVEKWNKPEYWAYFILLDSLN
ncbi:MAG: CHAT domain-containing protein [Muribaculaceae bacterium]|nr:CHAT domain-containing protein [Muribaculaceae bacterium]